MINIINNRPIQVRNIYCSSTSVTATSVKSNNNFTNTFIINSDPLNTEIKYIRVVLANEKTWDCTDSTYYITPSDIKSVEITED